MTPVEALAMSLCVLATNIALATPAQQVAACNAQPPQIQAIYLQQARFVLAPRS